MRKHSYILPICALLLLSGCHTIEGVGEDIHAAGKSISDEVGRMQRNGVNTPTGYAGQRVNRDVLKPPGMGKVDGYAQADAASAGTIDTITVVEDSSVVPPPPMVAAPMPLPPPAAPMAVQEPMPTLSPEGTFMMPEPVMNTDAAAPATIAAPEATFAPAVNETPVVHPAPVADWNNIGPYDGTLPSENPQRQLLGRQGETTPVRHGEAVTVFPVDDAASERPYVQPSYSQGPTYLTRHFGDVSPSEAVAYGEYGEIVQRIYFASGSVKVSADDRKQLRDLAEGLKRTENDVTVTIVGHSSKPSSGGDAVKQKMINVEMAQKRADAVAAVLRDAGLKASSLRVFSKGDDAPNTNPGGMRQEDADRRVEIYVEGK